MSKIPKKAFKVKFSADNHADISMSEGHIDTIEGKDEWIQANKFGLIGQEGDWQFDPQEGLPWVDNGKLPLGRLNIMGTNIDHDLVELYIRQQLNREPRNKKISQVDVDWKSKEGRTIEASARIKSIDEDLIIVEV